MRLRKILSDIEPVNIRGNLDIEINNIEYDSRQIKNNSLFICIDGFKDDGHKYINQAINKGAVAILIEKEIDNYQQGITYIRVNDSRNAMSYLAAAFYKYPLRELPLIGVTGTNGKTTTTYLIKSVLESSGFKTGLVGTIRNIIDKETLPASRTTPESLDLYKIFREMLNRGVDYVVMEVSSHALDLNRVRGMEFNVAVFTNITQDHLDYHKSIERYLKVKSKLFTQLNDQGSGVINLDDKHSQQIIEATAAGVLTYGINSDADIQARQIKLSTEGVSFILSGEKDLEINLGLAGRFNVYNALAAAGVGRVLGFKDRAIKKGLENRRGVDGRFELIKEGQDFTVVVDYAHTPDGMENVFTTARELVENRIIAVFGCGGDRDKSKRPLMGQIGARYSDYCILTSDNPRSEDPEDILNQIEKGITQMENPAPYKIIPDRKKAIFHAIEGAKKGDMIIIFGKGHETYQVFRDKTIHFDDREIASQALTQC